MNDTPVDVGETEVPAGVSIGQVFVIKAHEVKNGGVEVVDVHFVFHRREAKFVGGPISHAAFDSPSGEPD